MIKLDKLIKEICSDGVEYFKIGEIFELRNGYTPSKRKSEYWKEGTISWFTLKDIRVNGRFLENAIQKVTKEAVKGGKLIPKNSIIMSTTATIGEHALLKIDALTNQQITSFTIRKSFKNRLSIMFAFHYFYIYKEWCMLNSNQSGGMAILNIKKLKEFRIPLPPLPVQEEIVRILDNFTELTAELTARKKQYEYYRDKLLIFEDDVEWKELGEIGKLIRGSGLLKSDFKEEGFPCIHYGQIHTYYGTSANETISFVSLEQSKKLKKAKKGDVLIAGVSENIEDICKPLAWLGEDVAISGDMFAFRHNQNTKYITYLLQTTDFSRYKEKYAHGAKVTRLRQDKLLSYKIPIPPLDEQERIVSILDKFDALVNDISIGLPGEIEARQKQYEYYREKLLSFKPLDVKEA